MLHMAAETRADIISQVVGLIHEKLPKEQIPQVEMFVRQYYSQVDEEDLSERTMPDLYGAALSHWHFLRRFTRGSPKVRVYNPQVEQHGWQSTHTIIEIVNSDMPFLVDSVTMEVNRLGLTLHLIIHPVMNVRRDAKGELTELLPVDVTAENCCLESTMHVEVDRHTDPKMLEALQAGIARVLGDVRVAVEDWRKMLDRVKDIAADIDKNPPPAGAGDAQEIKAFLLWLADNHFTFLGYRDYDLVTEKGEDMLRIVPGSGLGILKESGQTGMSASFAALPPAARAFARAPQLLVLTKANSRSTVHRPGYLDYVGIKRFDRAGEVIGERRFLGLYASTAYSSNPADIPMLRHKVKNVVERAEFLPKSHMGKALAAILEMYPRDELFQISEQDLFDTALGILHLGERQRTRLFVRRDAFGRFFSCLVYVPREKYNTDLRHRMERVLIQAFNGMSSEFTVQLSESRLARIHITVRTRPGSNPDYDLREIEARLVQATRRWEDDLYEALLEHCGEERGNQLYRRYGNAFPAAYREDYPARAAVHDIEMMDALRDGDIGMNLYVPLEAETGALRFKLFHVGGPVPLSGSLPMLEHMGVKVLDEHPYEIEPEESAPFWLHDFGMSYGREAEIEVEKVKDVFHDAFARVWRGEIENDDFNRLVLLAEFSAREVTVLRAYCKYLRQTGFTFSQAYMEHALVANAGIARRLVELFLTRFDPGRGADRETDALAGEIETALNDVASLDEDRILRQFLSVIRATTRTNYFQRGADEKPKSYLSFKFNPALVPGLPEPKPMFEIFVYSPRVEGVHLRGGKVARGGIRWSDRKEDFRTEILGLVKAQMVKNAVIVPVGSKGGFVVKCPPPGGDREALMKEGIACYQTLLRGLLDLTDNLVGGKVVPPLETVRHDGDDPYLVVAADKGTATFSDIANGVSREYRFWLDDAFASGGSAGYDHKKMGITARGAWESVKRYFRELGIDTQATDFTVIGIGDMSGDVFGNGMLLSRHIKLVGAFDHRHVFIDPDPEPEASFRERERMFNLPRSSWADYEAKLISKGGGVYARSAKSITLSPEARQALGVAEDKFTPNDLIRAMLKAPVDLLYNGGIGTYVKASHQSHAEVGDRTNDAIRVNGRELRSRVVAEGGNLGFTQLGRIEYALAGGRINTDAIDNSGGVDCSDHEVNIKILLNLVMEEGELTEKQRNKLLAEMTDEVGALVLRDNYFQNQSLGVSGARAAVLLDAQTRFIRALERSGRLNREIEFLPSDEEIAERKKQGIGMTSPERAVLLAYSKMWLFDDLLASDVAEDPFISTTLERYFPGPLREKFGAFLQRHPLKREIIATYVTNSMVNRVGSTFVHRLQEETGASPRDIVRAYLMTREVYGMVNLWKAVEALDNKVADAVQSDMLIEPGRLIVRATLWFLRNHHQSDDIAKTIARFAPGVEALAASLDKLMTGAEAAAFTEAVARLAQAGVPVELATRVSQLDALYAALDIVEGAGSVKRTVEEVAAVHFAVGGRLNFNWLRKQIAVLPADSHWQTLAKAALRDDLSSQQKLLTVEAFRLNPKVAETETLIHEWERQNREGLERYKQVVADLQASGSTDLSMLSVALRELRNLV